MIVQRQRSNKLAIKQEDHAAFAGFLLEHWSDHSFPKNPARDIILKATLKHDAGWAKWDAAPRIDAKTHLPVDFSHITAAEAHDIWTRATKQFLKDDPMVALLITHHAYVVNENASRRDPGWKKFFSDFAQQRAALRDQLGLMHNDVEQPYSYLRMADWFSLAFCMQPNLGAEKPERYAGYSFKREGSEYLFRPYPFSARGLKYSLPVYPMKQGGYESEKELKAALKKPEHVEIILNALERWE